MEKSKNVWYWLEKTFGALFLSFWGGMHLCLWHSFSYDYPRLDGGSMAIGFNGLVR